MIGETCWMCGTDKKVTRHHAIPKYMNPIKNMEIPLCRKCHDKFHRERDEMKKTDRREIVYFAKVKQGDGKYKIQGSIANGKIIFPDNGNAKKIRPNRYYDVLIHELPKVAFARDIKRYRKFKLW